MVKGLRQAKCEDAPPADPPSFRLEAFPPLEHPNLPQLLFQEDWEGTMIGRPLPPPSALSPLADDA